MVKKLRFQLGVKIGAGGRIEHWTLATPYETDLGLITLEVRVQFHYGLDAPTYTKCDLFILVEGASYELLTPVEYGFRVSQIMDNEGLEYAAAKELLNDRKIMPAGRIPKLEIMQQAYVTWEAIKLIVEPHVTA